LLKKTPGFQFADFGTRRRFSQDWQETVVGFMARKDYKTMGIRDQVGFVGTSNVYLAKKFGVKPIGTMAHEYICLFQGTGEVPVAESQKKALQTWVDVYRGDLGIALSDTLGFDKFLRDFDKYFANLYEGVRQDSGNEFEWADRRITHYEKLGIDPKTKHLVFSDGLTFPRAVELLKHVNGRAKVSFGVGTNLTNDVGVKPLQIVMKLVEVNGNPVAKLSDSPGKTMCEDQEYISYLLKAIGKE
jgi:nicotinate phosphoribosyltransferase